MVLDDKVALVTGAGQGMGRAIAVALAGEGAKVALVEINAETLEDASTAVRGQGNPSLAIQADVGDLSDIDRMVRETVDTFGRVDILVNNAAVSGFLEFGKVEEEDWDRILRVNARGVFFLMQRVANELVRQEAGGRIINIASIVAKGYVGASSAPYAASKGAVISMTTNAAHQLGDHNITVNAICPGPTNRVGSREARVQRAEELGVTVEELQRRTAASIPVGRTNEPEDIAALAVFLAGPGARNITGQAYNVDGGLVMN
jgi:3-oxoacyl-[acyl-carrier protein] reductase